MQIERVEKEITRDVIGAFFEVYNNLGYGFLEFVYSLAMARELLMRGHTAEREVNVLLHFGPEARFYRVVHTNAGNSIEPISVICQSGQSALLVFMRFRAMRMLNALD